MREPTHMYIIWHPHYVDGFPVVDAVNVDEILEECVTRADEIVVVGIGYDNECVEYSQEDLYLMRGGEEL